ncbi:MAG: MoaD/ThiS family protein [Proteobacteria bacterium]|nr:MoaD/ThiS family protein [Pseudomonadota bacterium]
MTVKLFANLKDLAGVESRNIDCDDGISLEQLTSLIVDKIPGLKDILETRRVFISINQEMAQKNDIVKDGDEIALLPPFSGG